MEPTAERSRALSAARAHLDRGFRFEQGNSFERALEAAGVQEFYRVLYGFLPLGCKFAVPFPVIIDGLLSDPGEPSCERRRIGQRKSRQKFRAPYKGITRARTRVRVIRVKPRLKEFRAFLEMIFGFGLEFPRKFERNSLCFTNTAGTGSKCFVQENGGEAELGRI